MATFGSVSKPEGIASYYLTVSSLTPRAEAAEPLALAKTENPYIPASLSPYLKYGPVTISGALFVSVFFLMAYRKVMDIRRTMTAIVFALFAASIPMILPYIQGNVGRMTNAGPDDIPKNVMVKPVSKTSVIVRWETGAERVGAVRISTTPMTESSGTVYTADSGSQLSQHIVHVSDLVPGTVYEFEILSGSIWFDDSGKPLQFQLSRD